MYKRKRGPTRSTVSRYRGPYKKTYKRRSVVSRANNPTHGTVQSRTGTRRSNLRGASLLGTKHYATLVYGNTRSIGGSGGGHIYSATGLFDPDITGVGNQPRGFDQLMALYDHYTVLGSKITAWCAGESQGVFALITSDNATIPLDSQEMLEHRMLQSWRQVAGNPSIAGQDSGRWDKFQMVGKFSSKKFFSVEDPLGEHDLRGDVSNNPAEQAYFVFRNGTPSAIEVVFRIEYYVCFTEPKEPAPS